MQHDREIVRRNESQPSSYSAKIYTLRPPIHRPKLRVRWGRLALVCMTTATTLAVSSNRLRGLIVPAVPVALFAVYCAWRNR